MSFHSTELDLTPLTDAEAASWETSRDAGEYVGLDFARDLERRLAAVTRERDEAKAKSKETAKDFEAAFRTVRIENDQLREQVDCYRNEAVKWRDKANENTFPALREQVASLQSTLRVTACEERDSLREQVAKLTEERDEARQQIEAQCNQFANIADTLRVRGFVAGKPIDERVIALAQERDALRSQLASAETKLAEAQAQCDQQDTDLKAYVMILRQHGWKREEESLQEFLGQRPDHLARLRAAEDDTRRLDWLAEAFENIADLNITYQLDGDSEDSIGIIPAGWNIRCDSSCAEPLTINASTFRAAIDAALKGDGK